MSVVSAGCKNEEPPVELRVSARWRLHKVLYLLPSALLARFSVFISRRYAANLMHFLTMSKGRQSTLHMLACLIYVTLVLYNRALVCQIAIAPNYLIGHCTRITQTKPISNRATNHCAANTQSLPRPHDTPSALRHQKLSPVPYSCIHGVRISRAYRAHDNSIVCLYETGHYRRRSLDKRGRNGQGCGTPLVTSYP
jgi:hypothetical protein